MDKISCVCISSWQEGATLLWESTLRVVNDVGSPAETSAKFFARLVYRVENGGAKLEGTPQFIGKGSRHADAGQLDFDPLIDPRNGDFLGVQEFEAAHLVTQEQFQNLQ